MKNSLFLCLLFLLSAFTLAAQKVCTPEFLWEVGRVNGHSISEDGNTVYFSVSKYNLSTETAERKNYAVSINGGKAREIEQLPQPVSLNIIGNAIDSKLSPDGKKAIIVRSVKIEKVFGTDYYPELKNANVYIYDDLNYRHWDTCLYTFYILTFLRFYPLRKWSFLRPDCI